MKDVPKELCDAAEKTLEYNEERDRQSEDVQENEEHGFHEPDQKGEDVISCDEGGKGEQDDDECRNKNLQRTVLGKAEDQINTSDKNSNAKDEVDRRIAGFHDCCNKSVEGVSDSVEHRERSFPLSFRNYCICGREITATYFLIIY